MATLTEIVDLDSGVASSEATPEGQTVISSNPADSAKMALTGDDILEVSKEEIEEIGGKKDAVDNLLNGALAITTTVPSPPTDELDDDDEDIDESLGERFLALTEMFPDSFRSASANAVSTSIGFVKGSYSVTRQIVWIAVSTSILLFAPVMFELERLNVEEMMKQDRNRLVLGPASAVSGAPPTPGLMPPPPAR